MTSFMIKSHASRQLPQSWTNPKDSCAFCRIIKGELPAFRVYEDDWVIAFLDILPLRPGHTLVLPKVHTSRLSELDKIHASKLGESVTKVSNALVKALGNTGLNVVCNQEYAQAVPHVHFHVIPAPDQSPGASVDAAAPARTLEAGKPESHKEMHRFEFQARSELDEEDGKSLSAIIAAKM